MTAADDGAPGSAENSPQHNGLRAVSYVALTDVDLATGAALLTALQRARIAAYLGRLDDTHRRRLFVAAEERTDARTIVRATVRALADPDDNGPTEVREDPLAGIDTDAVFAQLVAGWHLDTHAAIRQAERDLAREDEDWRARLALPPSHPGTTEHPGGDRSTGDRTADDRAVADGTAAGSGTGADAAAPSGDADPAWLDDDHYIPPAPPPLPRLALSTVLGILLVAMGIVLLAAGTSLGLYDGLARLLGIGGLLVGVGVLLSRVRDFHRDEDDDGAAI